MVGDQKYHQYLSAFDYGNQLTGSEITRFWLDGDLRVSLKDQISFLRKVYAETLPIQQQHIKTLKQIMLSDSNSAVKIWSKPAGPVKMDGMWGIWLLTIKPGFLPTTLR